MRQIGNLSDAQQARRFEDYLLARGISSRVDATDDGFEVWIFEEDQVDQARDELEQYRADPDAKLYREAAAAASAVRKEHEKQLQAARKRMVDVRSRWEQPFSRRAPITFAMILISILVAATTSTGSLWSLSNNIDSYLKYLLIVPLQEGTTFFEPGRYNGLEATIRSGEVWRLVTPIFIHGSIIHILFNMLWLRDLGGAIEFRKGRLKLLAMVITIAVISNVAQCVIDGPNFRGMSGVVFGLFGYIWMKGRHDPGSGLSMPQNTTFLMLFFFALCFTGLMGPIANWCHGFGLLTGVVLGYVPTMFRS